MPRSLREWCVVALLIVLCVVLLHWAFPETIHANANGGIAGNVTKTKCDKQHVAQCKKSIDYWREKAHKAQAAIEWQKKEAKKLAALVTVTFNQPVKQLVAWTCIHNREGAWNDTGDPYWGGLQMDRDFMAAYGSRLIHIYSRDGSLGFANEWTPKQQMNVAQAAYESGRGFRPWPETARRCGYL